MDLFKIIAYTAISIAILLLLISSIVHCKEKFINEIDLNKSYNGITDHSDTPWTIPRKTKSTVQNVLKQILNMINDVTKTSYYLMSFDQLKEEKIDYNTSRFIADFFVHEIRALHTRRMIVIFTLHKITKDVNIEHINLSNAWKNPSKDFMDYPAPALILQDDNLLNGEYHIMGLNTSKLEHSVFNEKAMKPKEVPTPTEFQKWILPMGIDAAYQNPQALFPNRRQSNCWDTAGVNYIESETPLKVGVKNTPLTRYPYPYFNPTVNRQREFNETYHGLFDLVQNSSGVGAVGVASSP